MLFILMFSFFCHFGMLFTPMSSFPVIMIDFSFPLLLAIGVPDEPFPGAHGIENQGEYVGHKLGSVVGADLARISNPNYRPGRESHLLFPFLGNPDLEPMSLVEDSVSLYLSVFLSLFFSLCLPTYRISVTRVFSFSIALVLLGCLEYNG